MKTKLKRFGIVVLGVLVFGSCSTNDNGADPPEYFISAGLEGSDVKYAQTVFDGGVSEDVNVFDPDYHTISMQAYQNSTDYTDGYWTIRLLDVDIENINTPYTLKDDEAIIGWMDKSIKQPRPECESGDVLCFYSGAGVAEIEVTINEVKNNTIIGVFQGTLFHVRVNPTVIKDPNDGIEIVDGAFSIQYRIKN